MISKIEKSYVNHEKIQLALQEFFDRGGRIIETENPYQDTLVKQNFTENGPKTIYPESGYDSRKDLTGEDNLMDQKISVEELNIVNPDSENKLEKSVVDAENQIQN